MTEIHVQRWGQGPPVLLVHGGVESGEVTWAAQRPLAARWTLVVPDRRGYAPNPPIEREDFEVDAGDIAALLGDGMHLVGHSYGGVVALLAAARCPEAVRSLTVIEPPAFDLVRDDPVVGAYIGQGRERRATLAHDPDAFLRAFVAGVGSAISLPDPLPPSLMQHARLMLASRPPWEARIPLAELRAARFPTLVVSGGHSAVFDAACDALQRELGAERAVIAGAGHTVAHTGAPFNDRLERFLRAADATAATLP